MKLFKVEPHKVNINKSFLLPAWPAASPVVRPPLLCLFGMRRRRLVSLGLRVHVDEAGEDSDDGDED